MKGLSQSEAVSLLRASGDKVILLVSRQEIVETQDEEVCERETETETDRQRQTERQRDRQTDR